MNVVHLSKIDVCLLTQEITAAVVGGILFFIVAIILSVCTVKICNKRKRKKQEKGKIMAVYVYNK